MSKTILSIWLTVLILPLHAQERGIRPVSARLPSGQEIALYQNSYAVVVGVSDYDSWPDLPNAVRDAEEVAEVLRNLGFDVRLVRDPDSHALEQVLEDLEFQAGAEQDRLLFYFAGHGETETLADGGELGYIVPRDAPLKVTDQRGFVTAATSMQRLEQSALRMRFKHVLFVFDSCFSGSIFTLQRAAPQNISEKVALPVRQFITAGGKNETVPDQSVFKTTLLAALEGHGDLSGDGYLTGTELGLYLAEQVVNYSQGAQHPQAGKLRNPKLDKGDFVFVLEPSVNPPSPEAPPAPPPPPEAITLGHLQVNVDAPASRVYVTGKYCGTASPGQPLNLQNVGVGKISVKITADGYAPELLSTTLRANQWTQLLVQMRQANPPPAPKVESVTVYVTRTGKKYHKASCSYLRKSKIPISLQDAKSNGYTACSRCGPPE